MGRFDLEFKSMIYLVVVKLIHIRGGCLCVGIRSENPLEADWLARAPDQAETLVTLSELPGPLAFPSLLTTFVL